MVNTLASIPDKKYFSISEAAGLCKVKPHTLRFWEKEFIALNPHTKKGNRRYYKRDDILLIRKIRILLYERGLTISGAKKNLSSLNEDSIGSLKEEILEDLEELHNVLKKVVK